MHRQQKGILQQQTKKLLCLILGIIFFKYINKLAGWVVQHVMRGSEETLGIAECCGGNTQGSGTSGSDTEPLNNFIDRFCSLQLTGHTTPVYLLQQPWKIFNLLIMCQSTLWSCHNIIRQLPSHSISLIKTSFLPIPQTTVVTIHFELLPASL